MARRKAGLQGTEQLLRGLKELEVVVTSKIQTSAVKFAMQPYKDAVEDFIPKSEKAHRIHTGRVVAPGFASRHVLIKSTTGRTKGISWADVGVSPEAYYVTQFVEFGTSKQPAQPIMRRTFEFMRPTILKRYNMQLRRNLTKAIKKARKGKKQ